MEKLARVRRNAGDDGFALEGFDFESEFDPDEHDRRMDKAFDEGYYGREVGQAAHYKSLNLLFDRDVYRTPTGNPSGTMTST